MEKIDEKLVRRLAYEERLCLYRFISKENDVSNLNKDELFEMMNLVERLTEINLTSNSFTIDNVMVLGLENCCNYFKALCEQYEKFKNPESEYSEYEADFSKFDVVIGNRKKIKSDIRLYNAAKEINNVIKNNYTELINNQMFSNPEDMVEKYAACNTFASMYYCLRDLIEGKTYYDGEFMTTYRELPEEYEKISESLLGQVAQVKKIPVGIVKMQMLDILNQGIVSLSKTNFSLNEEKKANIM